MKINNKSNIASVELAGMVFMYGNTQVIAENREGEYFLVKVAGSDDFAEDFSEEAIDEPTFNKLIEAFENIDVKSEPSDEANTVLAIEDEEETGAFDWYACVADAEGEIISAIRGTNPEGDAFASVCSALTNVRSEFNEVREFFKSVNGEDGEE